VRSLLLVSLAITGCAAPPADDPPSADANCIGMTVGEAIEALGLTLEEPPVIEEPAGVARGVRCLSPGKEETLLYFRPGGVPSHQPDAWTPENLKKLRVIGIARLTDAGWEREGEVIWYYDAK
jgi:hypothetical protein